ncbi:MAG: DDE-type integrase/transposase/recombinase, partial [Nitrososphaerales archaeon]
EDPKLNVIIQKMLDTCEAEEASDNRFYQSYALINGILDRQERNAVVSPWRLVVPQQLRQRVFQLIHDSITGGRYVVLKTYAELKKRYWWKRMFSDTKRYIAGCPVCQVFKQPNAPIKGHMVNKDTPNRVFQRIAIDYIEKRQPTKRGNRYALVMIDQTSRYVVAAPSRKARAVDTIRLVEENLFAEWGIPRQIICDNGSHFKNKNFQNFCEEHGIQLIFTTPYHPQSNGMVENANKVIKEYIHKFQLINRNNWDENLKNACYARNTKVNETTGYTPFFLAKGWDPFVVADNVFPVIYPDDDDSPSVIAEKREKAVLHAQKMTQEAQKRRKNKYDSKRSPADYQVGDYVWMIDHTSQPGQPRLLGPYKIIKQTDEKTFILERRFRAKKSKTAKCVAEQLVPFVPPMFEDPFSRERFNDEIDKQLKQREEDLPPLQQLKFDSDYFKALLGERMQEIISLCPVENDDDRSEGPKNTSSLSSAHGNVDTTNQPQQQQPSKDHNKQPGCLYSGLSPFMYNAYPDATPIQIVSTDKFHGQKKDVNRTQHHQDHSTLDSVSTFEDPRDKADPSFIPRKVDEIPRDGPAARTRAKINQQQQQQQLIHPVNSVDKSVRSRGQFHKSSVNLFMNLPHL